MTSRGLAIVLLLSCAACSKNSAPAPSAPTPPPTRVIRLGGNLNFGDVLVGEVRTDGVLVINNDGNTALTVTGITSPSGSVYTPNWTSGTIAPGASQTVAVRFVPTAEQSYSGTLTVTGDQTSGANTIAVIGTGTRPPRRGTVTDPSGDVGPMTNPPDLVGATIDVSGGNLTVTVTFAPGTMSPGYVYCDVLLDTDENPATGTHGSRGNDAMIGADAVIFFLDRPNVARARVARTGPNNGTVAPLVDVTFPSADQARVVVPMNLLDNDDGRLAFKVEVGRWLEPIAIQPGIDMMPNVGLPPGVTR